VVINVLLKKTIEIFIIKVYKKEERIITLIPLLSLLFNPIKFKGIKCHDQNGIVKKGANSLLDS